MKTIRYLSVFVCIIIVFCIGEGKAQNGNNKNNVNPNTSYKDQIPVSKGNKFKDSFKNDSTQNLSEGNYKQQQPKRKSKKITTKQNFNTSQKESGYNSKHPYGL